MVQKNNGLFYALTVLILTWGITAALFIQPSIGLKTFPIIMFIPAAVAIIFNIFGRKGFNGFKQKMNAKALLFGILYPLVFILLCAVLARILGIGTWNADKFPDGKMLATLVITILLNLFTVLGEEYGWRGYLLPQLTEQWGKTKATVILGIIWALYHAPAVFFLAKTTGISHPLLLCLIQAGCVFAINFPFSYCYYLSGNIIPVLFLHSVWNVINTNVLGDIYTNEQGLVDGNIVLFNGEGLLGLVLGALFIYWFIRQFKKDHPLVKTSYEGLKKLI
ncbi:CPBP family intramembrane glutamic endopeptidase [Neobacillus vireti]|uniref:Abortive infection protein n=1 Tax=Neobacillus vireti LMG 21834 TaxID=1131730 RepID=A0AB94IMV7_9BACI|nr:CPBP family intramembrane glutamic endopeptidase [Neobacillus vireti]ETI68349.1 abortive infection protein [Neobacillus vireti LMG 21834]KLT16303.1 abortive infection protein [Neobacillus vireti]